MIVSGVAYSLLQWRYSSLICFILTSFEVRLCCFCFCLPLASFL
ncbi:hypothetical protein [Escherichia phage pEC-N1203-2Af.1]|nr:hypothetical protein [Escherichia phage pEC-N1203-2Af.1]